MKMKCVWLAAMLLAMACVDPDARADLIVGTPGADWQTFPATLNTGTPYWNGTGNNGVGNFISATGFFAGATGVNYGSPGISPTWWGMGPLGPADPSVHFTGAQSTLFATLMLKFADGLNEIGWYDHATGDRHPLFPNSSFPPAQGGTAATVSFVPTVDYGFYVTNYNSHDNIYSTYFTDSLKNAVDPGQQHFAVFGEPLAGGYILGVEDLALPTPDPDYNDAIFSVSREPFPVVPPGLAHLR